MNILMVSGESLPFSKTGGLGDVVYSLSKEFVLLNQNVSVAIPYYGHVDYSKFEEFEHLIDLEIAMNWRKNTASIYKTTYKNITYYLIKNDFYFGRNTYYGFYDDAERFAFFQNAVIELIKNLPHKIDIVHVHDWQAGMIPCLLKEKFYEDKKLNKIKTVLTIHNPLFKGYFSEPSLYDFYELNNYLYFSGKVRLDGQVSTLKAAIKYADKITTVSPTHAYELTTPEGSFGLWYDMTLRRDDFIGVLNGMDYDEFDPINDKLIAKNYDVNTFKEGKLACKKELEEKYGLEKNRPLYAVVSRLSDQKGLDLIISMVENLINNGGNFALVGSGEEYAENYFRNIHDRFPNNTLIYIGYNNELAHKLYSASDFFIMPSKFEPCGLGQMIAHRYGSIPIVRETGGLKDSVIGYHDSQFNIYADGFKFSEYSSMVANDVINETLYLYKHDIGVINELKTNGMKVDHTWTLSAKKYLEIYGLIVPKTRKK